MINKIEKTLAVEEITSNNKFYKIYSINKFCNLFGIKVDKLSYFTRIVIENSLRNIKDEYELSKNINVILNNNKSDEDKIFSFYPGRVLLQDYTGIPLLVDLAAMREFIASNGYDPKIINPVLPTALVVDHSVIAGFAGESDSIKKI
jgi:aconitate hydratase